MPVQLARLREQAPDAARAFGRITTEIQQLHRSIATAVFDAVGAAESTKVVHDDITDHFYDSIRTIASGFGTAADRPRP
ncbi:hypothetical protein [Nocardia amamiensis]|uniref:hypothetical protein n=1 Tax=Nocardia amamiensis TaxID=404578 RepID=UPI0012F498A7|nr:hypothetical protein [Nocardia amamiensis]